MLENGPSEAKIGRLMPDVSFSLLLFFHGLAVYLSENQYELHDRSCRLSIQLAGQRFEVFAEPECC